jgi:hypothetical protein
MPEKSPTIADSAGEQALLRQRGRQNQTGRAETQYCEKAKAIRCDAENDHDLWHSESQELHWGTSGADMESVPSHMRSKISQALCKRHITRFCHSAWCRAIRFSLMIARCIHTILRSHWSRFQHSSHQFHPGIWAVMRFGQTTAKAVREIKHALLPPISQSYRIIAVLPAHGAKRDRSTRAIRRHQNQHLFPIAVLPLAEGKITKPLGIVTDPKPGWSILQPRGSPEDSSTELSLGRLKWTAPR